MPENLSGPSEHLVRQGSVTPCNEAVVILGMNDSMADAPLTDPGYDLYALSAQHRIFPANLATLWFQVHRPGSGIGHIDEPDHRAWLQTWGGCPVFMCEAYKWAPASVAFPIEEVTRDVGPPSGEHYYTSSIDYMVAWAIHTGYKRIELYGVDMVLDSYMPRRASLQWYLGVAAGRGIQIHVSPRCALLKAGHVYGFEDWAPSEQTRTKELLNAKMAEVEQMRGKAQVEWENALGKMKEADGYLRACQEFKRLVDMRDRGVK